MVVTFLEDLMAINRPPAPSDDRRWRVVDATMRRHGYSSDALIESLHTAQEAFGYLDDDALRFVGESLQVPLSKVYGVATFYHFFNLKPQGQHTCVLCMGTACYIKGIPGIIAAIEDAYGVKPGETTPDGQLSLMTARCIGACGLAPAAVFDGVIVGKLTPQEAINQISRCMSDESR